MISIIDKEAALARVPTEAEYRAERVTRPRSDRPGFLKRNMYAEHTAGAVEVEMAFGTLDNFFHPGARHFLDTITQAALEDYDNGRIGADDACVSPPVTHTRLVNQELSLMEHGTVVLLERPGYKREGV